MPQMMPINWMISLFTFILIFILFNILNYYIFIYKNKMNNLNFKFNNNNNKKLNWKW